MRAVVFRTPGGPEVLSVIDVPVPEPAEGQVRVKVLAAPVFSADVAARSGAFGSMLPPRPYYSLGWDMAGTVDKLGSGVVHLALADSVIGISSPMYSPAGTQAEYLVLNASDLAPSPTGLSLAEASTIPANGLTAFQALDAMGLGIRLHACNRGRRRGGWRLRGGVGAATRYPRSWRREFR